MKILMLMFRFQLTVEPYDPNRTEPFMDYLFPLSLPSLSAYLKQHGKDVTCVNLNHKTGHIRDVVKEMHPENYDIIFLGGLSLFYPHIKDTIKYIREFAPRTKIVVGGGIITAQPEIMFKLLEPDFGIIGEGEETALELVNYFEKGGNLNCINGLIFSDFRMPEKKFKIIVTKPRPQIKDLDSLPFPDYESFDFFNHLDNVKPPTYYPFCVVDKPRYYPLLASRSCPFLCSFCMHPLGNKYYQRSVDNIMEELKLNVEKYNINVIIIYDELFTYNMDRLRDFCKKFKAYSDTRPEKLWFYCNTRVDNTTDEMMKLLKDSGAFLMTFGLESYSKTVLDSMKKHTTPEQIKTAITNARNNNLGVQGSFIFGDVAETMDTANETLNFLKKYHKTMGTAVSSVFIIPFQGSPIYKQCIREGIIDDEIKFIEERSVRGYIGGDPLNMTKINNSDFESLKDKVFTESITHGIYAKPERTWKVGSDTFVEIKCPWCGKTSTLMNMPVPGRGLILNVGCRHCFYRFDMVGDWFWVINTITKILGLKRVQRLIELKRKFFNF